MQLGMIRLHLVLAHPPGRSCDSQAIIDTFDMAAGAVGMVNSAPFVGQPYGMSSRPCRPGGRLFSVITPEPPMP